MKKLITIILLICSFHFGMGQNEMGKSDDFDRIALDIFIPENAENIPELARSLLQSRLTEVAANHGLGGEGIASRFLLTAKMEVLTKDITPTAPAMEAYTFNVYLYIVDNIDRIVLASTSFTTKGAGTNKNKAYTNGLSSVNLRNENITRFLASGKQKIIMYYNSKCDFIIANAIALASQNRFEEAILTLTSVPEVCKDCYMNSLEAIGPIYQEYINHECARFLNIANGLFAANPNNQGAIDAVTVLSLVDPDSNCFESAGTLIGKIEQKMRQDENRDWNFMERVWGDRVELEKLRIQAYRDVGVAFGENQQSNYDVLWLFD
jgi:hypothetical protein